MATHIAQRLFPIQSIKLSIDDVRKIYDRCAAYVEEQADIEIKALQKPSNKTDEEFETDKKQWREAAFKVTVTIRGRTDEGALHGEDRTVFDSPNRPAKIGQVYFTNKTAYQGVSAIVPLTQFELNLDFSRPPLLDARTPISGPTPNN